MIESVEELKERQINEIAKDLCSRYSICTCVDRDGHCSTPQQHARIIYGLGYKKQVEGKWLFPKYAGQEYYKCSCCGKDYPLPPTWNAYDVLKYLNYCSSCGAKMSKEEVV